MCILKTLIDSLKIDYTIFQGYAHRDLVHLTQERGYLLFTTQKNAYNKGNQDYIFQDHLSK
jgi:hypothetical protein